MISSSSRRSLKVGSLITPTWLCLSEGGFVLHQGRGEVKLSSEGLGPGSELVGGHGAEMLLVWEAWWGLLAWFGSV